MISDPKIQDGFRELLLTQESHDVPDLLESRIMASIEAAPERRGFQMNLQPVFILGLLASFYLLLAVLCFYYYPRNEMMQDIKTMTGLFFLVKLCYDLNEVLPGFLRQAGVFKRFSHR